MVNATAAEYCFEARKADGLYQQLIVPRLYLQTARPTSASSRADLLVYMSRRAACLMRLFETPGGSPGQAFIRLASRRRK